LVWKTQSLSHGDLELVMLPQIGGRMMDIKFHGASLLFQNPDLHGLKPDLNSLQELPTRARHLSFPLWGGEKTWISPDAFWPDGAPYPVLDSGEYSFEQTSQHKVQMISEVCPVSGLQIIRTIELGLSDRWSIQHRVTNKATEPRMVGLWSVMMTRRPATYYFYTGSEQEPTTVFGDPGDAYKYSGGIGCLCCETQREFKVGCHPAAGVSAARISGQKRDVWILNHVSSVGYQEEYAHGHALEFYNSGHYDYGELEWHSQALLLQPDQSIQFELGYQALLATDDVLPPEMIELASGLNEYKL